MKIIQYKNTGAIHTELTFFERNRVFERNVEYENKLKIESLKSLRRLSIDKLNETYYKEARCNILDTIFGIDKEIDNLKPHDMHVFLNGKNNYSEIVDYEMETRFFSIGDFWVEYR